MIYRYTVRYIDSEIPNPQDASETQIEATQPVTFVDAQELIKEQLDANCIYVSWVKVIFLQEAKQ